MDVGVLPLAETVFIEHVPEHELRDQHGEIDENGEFPFDRKRLELVSVHQDAVRDREDAAGCNLRARPSSRWTGIEIYEHVHINDSVKYPFPRQFHEHRDHDIGNERNGHREQHREKTEVLEYRGFGKSDTPGEKVNESFWGTR